MTRRGFGNVQQVWVADRRMVADRLCTAHLTAVLGRRVIGGEAALRQRCVALAPGTPGATKEAPVRVRPRCLGPRCGSAMAVGARVLRTSVGLHAETVLALWQVGPVEVARFLLPRVLQVVVRPDTAPVRSMAAQDVVNRARGRVAATVGRLLAHSVVATNNAGTTAETSRSGWYRCRVSREAPQRPTTRTTRDSCPFLPLGITALSLSDGVFKRRLAFVARWPVGAVWRCHIVRIHARTREGEGVTHGGDCEAGF